MTTFIVMHDPALIAAATAHLRKEEGVVSHAYQDHLGYWTIGVGRLIDERKGGGLAPDEINYLLANDITKRIDRLSEWPSWRACEGNVARQTALLSMAFQMGIEGLAGFKNSLRLCSEKQWVAAADSMMKSLWAKQTPSRAKRVTDMLRTGVL